MRNQYKRLDVFRCTHESHQGFGHVVSVYHVLKEKSCYPHGCIYFKWKCRKLGHKLPCPRSYEHVGKKCASCADYYDEKVVKRPKLLLSEKDYRDFLNELQDFGIWLNTRKGREAECAGTILSVKPRFILHPHYNRNSLSVNGFLVTFQEGFIGLTHLEDPFYLLLSPSQQGRLRLCEGDRVEFRATMRLDRGRIILYRLRGMEIEERGGDEVWTTAAARQALFRGRMYDKQYEKCLHCPYGSLVDIQESPTSLNGRKRRNLFCLKGIENPEYCIVQVSQQLFCTDNCRSGERLVVESS